MRINVSGTWWNLDALDTIPSSALGVSEATALQLLRDWINGEQHFTFHTSGSTGTPKSITFHRDQLEASARLTLQALGLRHGMRCLVCLDTRFVAGALMVVRSVLADMDLIIREPSANPLAGSEPADFIAVVPLQLTTLLEESPSLLQRVSVVIIGGAPLPEAVIPQLETFENSFYATYGMTETLTHIALRKLNGPGQQQSFHLLPGILASADDRGCLVISAPHLGPEPVRTNDLVEWMEDGGFRIAGRFNDVINSGGVKVQPQRVEFAVEQVLKQMGIRCRFFVAAIPDDRLTESVGLVMEGSPLPPPVEAELKDLLSVILGRFELPRYILYSTHFEETDTQKIDRKGTVSAIVRKTP